MKRLKESFILAISIIILAGLIVFHPVHAETVDQSCKSLNGKTVCHMYLIGEIRDASSYILMAQQLSFLKLGDIVYLHLEGPGGSADGLLYLLNAINNSKAEIVAVVDGSVASADAVLAVATKKTIINGDAAILFHSVSSSNMANEICEGMSGRDRGLSIYIKCMENAPKEIIFYNSVINRYVYPILTSHERKEYDAGHDIIITGKDLHQRIDKRG